MEAYLQWIQEILKAGPENMTVWAFVVGWLATYGLDSLRAAIIRFGDKMPWRFGWLASLARTADDGGGDESAMAGLGLLFYGCAALAAIIGAGYALAGDWEIRNAAFATGTGIGFYILHSLIFAAAKFGDWSLRGIGHKLRAGWNWVWDTRSRRRARRADAETKRRELEGDNIWQAFDSLRKEIRRLTKGSGMFSSYADGIDDFVDKRLLQPLDMRKRLLLGIPTIAPYACDYNKDGKIDENEAASIARKREMEQRLIALDRQLTAMRESLAHKIPLIVDAQTRDNGGDMAKSAMADLELLAAAIDDTMKGDEMAFSLVAIADEQMRQIQSAAQTAGPPAVDDLETPSETPTAAPRKPRTSRARTT